MPRGSGPAALLYQIESKLQERASGYGQFPGLAAGDKPEEFIFLSHCPFPSRR